MLKKEVNISSFQKNLPELMDIVMKGDEIIITKSNIPVAKVTPIEKSITQVKNNYLTAKAIEAKRAFKNEASENWFG